jgi:hypothetical protein
MEKQPLVQSLPPAVGETEAGPPRPRPPSRRQRIGIVVGSLGVAYGAMLAAWLLLSVLQPPIYQHYVYLSVGLIALVWSLAAIVSVSVSLTGLFLSGMLSRWFRWPAVTLNIPLVLVALLSLGLSDYSLYTYEAGIDRYSVAAQVCGGPPVLAGSTFGGTNVIVPASSEYDRLKYSTLDLDIFGNYTYFCSLADAEVHGYFPQH